MKLHCQRLATHCATVLGTPDWRISETTSLNTSAVAAGTLGAVHSVPISFRKESQKGWDTFLNHLMELAGILQPFKDRDQQGEVPQHYTERLSRIVDFRCETGDFLAWRHDVDEIFFFSPLSRVDVLSQSAGRER